MKMVGISKVVSNQNPQEIMAFWESFFSNNISALIPNQSSPCLFCVYTEYQGDYQKPYKMIIGHAVDSFENVPSFLETIEFSYKEHTQYTVKGDLPKGVMDQWQAIWNNNIPRSYLLDFQRHNPNGSVDIFVEYKKQ